MSQEWPNARGSYEIRRDNGAQDDRPVTFPLCEPPDRALLDMPFVGVIAQQPADGLTQRRLMSDDEHRAMSIRPAGSFQHRSSVCAGRDPAVYFVLVGERLDCLLCARRWTAPNYRVLRQARTKPFRNSLRLLVAFGRQLAGKVRIAFFGIGVAPEDEIHCAKREG